ncbi:protein of unknown function [Paraburkholderia dioscoreae]|uniref:Uncharacterized protein n=1 Tax=Paraburkholderia dioscoreae TaxID=2604047 RepID=A0A5Q4YT31_9BURK|nr:protein of unknown function [Paraburkholderia dioscoreae]
MPFSRGRFHPSPFGCQRHLSHVNPHFNLYVNVHVKVQCTQSVTSVTTHVERLTHSAHRA